MIYFACLIVAVFCFLVFAIQQRFKTRAVDFEKKIQLLESLIKELSQNLEYQNQKVKLTEDLKAKFVASNYKLSQSIFDLNLDLFEALYSKK